MLFGLDKPLFTEPLMMFGRVGGCKAPSRAGDAAAQMANLKPLMARVAGFLRSQGLSGSQLEDALQETMARTCGRSASMHMQNPVSYAMQVARTVVVDHWRSRAPETEVMELDTIEAPASCLEQSHLTREKLRLVQEAIEQLPPMRRRVFVRRKFEGKSRAQIARELDLPVETVKKHITRAMVSITFYLESRGLSTDD